MTLIRLIQQVPWHLLYLMNALPRIARDASPPNAPPSAGPIVDFFAAVVAAEPLLSGLLDSPEDGLGVEVRPLPSELPVGVVDSDD